MPSWLRRRPKKRRLLNGEMPVRWPDPDRANPDVSQFLITNGDACASCGKCPEAEIAELARFIFGLGEVFASDGEGRDLALALHRAGYRRTSVPAGEKP